MDYYLEIKVEPDLEISAQALLNNLFAKLHRAISQHCIGEIGVSFPQYGEYLGKILRLHGSEQALSRLMEQTWLKGLRDYTQVSPIQAIPNHIQGYRNVYRVQKKSPHNLRKRVINKGKMNTEEALEKFPDESQEFLYLPFIQLQSLSTKQVMRLYIQLGELSSTPTRGKFSSYGLSRTTTIPWF
ncbi:type I-F CRISPR-associated endoribonuclease Cas6/Csy4 [Mergibacter septicus]|uniref:type I-F CRISPR-associated endoribonuclease Cas6/Csy4 n=1 Tax=Mergibacter septicus TaxID=221402 RepID=UPI001C797FB8|nr:type I-F CRISPR-associated endoribonuclease Cas6/Csy4 [Mergibacter septicus]QDJ13785.1 type I-F CRISPR-associated endoribonuclease Cas6/Csy4 [Mergibacter septicus]